MLHSVCPQKVSKMLRVWEDWCDDWSTVLWRTGDQTNMAAYLSSVSCIMVAFEVIFWIWREKNIVFAENATKMLE